MKENSLKSGDKIGPWVIEKEVTNGCIYAVHHKDVPRAVHCLKMREPQNLGRFNKELGLLKRININPHPSFQRLLDYSDKPESLWMVVTPLMSIERELSVISLQELSKVNPMQFIDKIIAAYIHAIRCRAPILSVAPCHFYITKDHYPFFIDLEDTCTDDPAIESQIDFQSFKYIIQRFIDAAAFGQRQKDETLIQEQIRLNIRPAFKLINLPDNPEAT